MQALEDAITIRRYVGYKLKGPHVYSNLAYITHNLVLPFATFAEVSLPTETWVKS